MSKKINFAVLVLSCFLLMGCYEDVLTLQEEVIAKEVSTVQELQAHCNTLNALEEKKPFYKEKHNYKIVSGAFVKKGSGLRFKTISGVGTQKRYQIILHSNSNQIIVLGHEDLNLKENGAYQKLNEKFSDSTYGVCAYSDYNQSSSTNQVDKTKFIGKVETLTRISKD